MTPYGAPVEPTPPPKRSWAPWQWGCLASFLTLVVVLAIGLVAILVNPGNEEARGEKVGEGGARLALIVGVVTGLVVWSRRKKPSP